MSTVTAFTEYHDVLDTSDPEWRKAREELWRQEVSGRIKDGATYKLVRRCKEIFMGDLEWLPAGVETWKPDFEDEERHYSHEGMYWQLHPIQNEAKWRRVIVELPPEDDKERAALEESVEALISCRLARLPSISSNPFSYLGWSRVLGDRFTRYCLGEVYRPSGYVFEGYKVNPPISPSLMFSEWLHSHIYIGDISSSYWQYSSRFVDYAFSLLDYVHPALLSGKDSATFRRATMEITASVRRMVRYTEILADYLKNQDNPFGDSEARYEYFLSLVDRILSLPEDHPLRILWNKSKGKPHISDPRREKSGDGPLSPEEDVQPMPKGSKPAWFPDYYIPPYIKP